MKDKICNTIEIACTPGRIYSYVTQPWLWHEWHPNSKPAKAKTLIKAKGAAFDEVIEFNPLSPSPFKLRRKTSYKVIYSEPNSNWIVEEKNEWRMAKNQL